MSKLGDKNIAFEITTFFLLMGANTEIRLSKQRITPGA